VKPLPFVDNHDHNVDIETQALTITFDRSFEVLVVAAHPCTCCVFPSLVCAGRSIIIPSEQLLLGRSEALLSGSHRVAPVTNGAVK
jgi:hypothetical protein